jgi:hypothetical protein
VNGKRRIAAYGLALALGLASVAAGQSGPWDATRDARPRRWNTVFVAPPLGMPVNLALPAAREGLASAPGDWRDLATLALVPVEARPPPPPPGPGPVGAAGRWAGGLGGSPVAALTTQRKDDLS